MKINNKGIVIYYFLVLFFLINFTAGAIMNEFLKSIRDETLHLEKEQSRILAESGFEISLNKIYKNEFGESYFNDEDFGEIRIKIEDYNDENFLIESVGSYKNSKTRVTGKIKMEDSLQPEILERKMW